jgi:hypothetical protein
MKNLARLILFFSLSFAILLLFSAGLRFFQIRIDGVRLLPVQPRMMLTDFVTAARWALPLGIYASLLAGLSYAARLNAGLLGGRRRPLAAPLAMLCLFVLALAFGGGVSLGLERLGNMVPARDTARPLGEPGMLLTRGAASIVLLRAPDEDRGPRVVAIPGRPLLYQEQPLGPDNRILSLPPVPFRADGPWFLRSIALDFSLSGRQLEARLGEGLLSFFSYAGALVFLLVSLGFILKFSNWPLANLFLGCLCFRGVLAAETFLNSPDMGELLDSFLGNRFPLTYTTPLIFCFFGLLVNLYSFLVYLAKRRSDEEEI